MSRNAIPLERVPAGYVLMPEKPDGTYMQAIEDYFASRLKYKGRPQCDALKADCWMALMAYYAMVEVAKNAAPQALTDKDVQPVASPAVAASPTEWIVTQSEWCSFCGRHSVEMPECTNGPCKRAVA